MKIQIVIFKAVNGVFEEVVALPTFKHMNLLQVEKSARKNIDKMEAGKYGYMVMRGKWSLTGFKHYG